MRDKSSYKTPGGLEGNNKRSCRPNHNRSVLPGFEARNGRLKQRMIPSRVFAITKFASIPRSAARPTLSPLYQIRTPGTHLQSPPVASFVELNTRRRRLPLTRQLSVCVPVSVSPIVGSSTVVPSGPVRSVAMAWIR